MSKKQISVLLVDDNDMMRALLRGILRGEEYNVVGEARNGAAAIDMSSLFMPDIICLDILMPETDGLTALIEIKAKRADVDVVMITSSSDPETVQAAIGSGASGFIVKPFNAAKVLKTLERITRQREQRQAQEARAALNKPAS